MKHKSTISFNGLGYRKQEIQHKKLADENSSAFFLFCGNFNASTNKSLFGWYLGRKIRSMTARISHRVSMASSIEFILCFHFRAISNESDKFEV